MASFVIKIVSILMLTRAAHGSCVGSTLQAGTGRSYISQPRYSNYEDCTYYIRPSSLYVASDYYLEISWVSFNVKGNMPSCSHDYVEVFLTSSYRSIGKYCSSDTYASKPFTMYSHDGYAKIKFHSDSSVTGSFKFEYRLKSIRSNSLGSESSTSCTPSVSYGNSGNIYSQGWPEGYAQSYSGCTHRISAGSNKYTRVVFMDINLNMGSSYYCSSSNNVQLKGSNYYTYSGYATNIATMCSTSLMKRYERKYKNLFIVFKRTKGSSSSYRGFVAGYISYGGYSPTIEPKLSYKTSYSINIGKIVGSLFGTILFICCIVLLVRKCNRRNPGVVIRNNQPASTTTTAFATSSAQSTNAHPIQYNQASANAGIPYPYQPVLVPHPYSTANPTSVPAAPASSQFGGGMYAPAPYPQAPYPQAPYPQAPHQDPMPPAPYPDSMPPVSYAPGALPPVSHNDGPQNLQSQPYPSGPPPPYIQVMGNAPPS